jgi:uncharacterized protein (DUF58 family)
VTSSLAGPAPPAGGVTGAAAGPAPVTARLTGFAPTGVRLVALAVFLGVVSGRPELFLVAVPLVVVLLSARRVGRPPRYALTHEVSATRLFEGDRLTATVTLAAERPLPLVELLVDVPPPVMLASARPRAAFRLGAGERRRWTYELCCPARGRFTLGSVHVRIRDRAGVRVFEASHPGRTTVSVYPRVPPLRQVPQPLRTQTSVGNYVAAAAGAGLEPAEIRPFAPGDPVRRVNWRASLRLGTLYVTQHHLERNADVVLMLDALSQVGVPPVASLDLCARAAAGLASAYLARKDRVGLIEYGGTFRWVRPAAGRAQFERVMDALLAVQPTFTYVRKELALVPPRILPPRALVIALSPLLDRRFVDAVADLLARRFDVVLVAVSPVEVTRTVRRLSPLEDLACRLWAVEHRAEIAGLRRRGLAVLEWTPDQPVEVALAPLARRRRRAPAA